ncbi:MAG: DUF3987 domain-containing protein [Desulfobacterales bacterium]|nr:DUF3987 domain-containing protein [Desulfobacterales bacterium]
MNYLLVTKGEQGNPVSFDDSILNANNRCRCPIHDGSNENSFYANMDDMTFKCHSCERAGKIIPEHQYISPEEFGRQQHNKNSSPKTDFTAWLQAGNDDFWDDDKETSEPKEEDEKELQHEINNNNIIREHIYTDVDNNHIHKTVIFKNKDGKKAAQMRWEDGQWQWGLTYKDGTKVQKQLYNLPGITRCDNNVIIYVEGEKDADTLIKWNITNVTTFGSCNKPSMTAEQINLFKDKKIIFIPDNDRVGYKCVRDLGRQLFNIAKEIKVVFLPEVKHKEDITDWIENNGIKDRSEIVSMIKNNNVLYEDASEQLFRHEDEFDTLLSIQDELSKHRHFPIDELPWVIRNYAGVKSETTNSHIEFHALATIAGAASLLQSKFVINVLDEWYAYPSISFILVADSGESKTHPLREGIKRIYDYAIEANVKYEQEQEDYNKWKDRRRKRKLLNDDDDDWKQPPVRQPYVITKFTLEGLRECLKDNPKGVLIHVDELDGMFKSLNQYKGGAGDDITTLMNILDGEPAFQGLASKSIMIAKPRASLISTVQRKTIRKIYTEDTKDIGFAFRFLFANPPVQKYFQMRELNGDELERSFMVKENLDELYDALKEIPTNVDSDGKLSPKEVRWENRDTYLLMSDFNNRYIDRLRHQYRDFNNEVSGVLSKIVTFTPKVALLLQLIKYYSNESKTRNVEHKTLKQAIELMKYFIYHNYMVLKTTGDSETDNTYQFVMSYIAKYQNRDKKIVVRNLQQKKKHGYKSADEIRKKIDKMIAVGKAIWLDNKRLEFQVF